MTKDKEHDDVQRYYNRCRSEEIAADKERADKERDDELIAEMVGVLKEAQAYISDGRPGRHGGINSKINAMLAKLKPAPKPDRAEVCWQEAQDAFDDGPENSKCKAAYATIRRHFDELRAEWEAEQPAVVVPGEVVEAAKWVRNTYSMGTKGHAQILADHILSLDGAKGGA